MGVPVDIIYRQRPGAQIPLLFWSNLSHEICDQDICTKSFFARPLPVTPRRVAARLVRIRIRSRVVRPVWALTSGSQFLLMAHWPSNYRHLRAAASDDCTRLSCSSWFHSRPRPLRTQPGRRAAI